MMLTRKYLYDAGEVSDAYVAPTVAQPNNFGATAPSVVNIVNVAIAPALPTAGDVTPDIQFATATDPESVAQFGAQETPVVITLLATIEDAEILADFYIRDVPAYWFSNLRVMIADLSDANKTLIAGLEIGDQIAVIKTFPAPASPTSITQKLFVEGIDHDISIDEGHYVTIHAGPAEIYRRFTLDSATLGLLDDVTLGLG